MEGIVRAWGKILQGYRPNLSIEITRECPLRCPGCYAYGDEHLGGGQTLRTLSDRKGQPLVDGILEVVDRLKPLVPEGSSLPDLALRFILHHPAVATTIPGMRRPRHVEANLAASDAPPLAPGAIDALRAHRWDRDWPIP